MSLGDKDLIPLEATLKSYKDIKTIPYHSQCRKDIVNSTNLSQQRKRSVSVSTENEKSILSPSKQGRPRKESIESMSTPRSISNPSKNVPKARICMFYNCKFCRSESVVEIHQVVTDNKGQRLLDIKKSTHDDNIRASLSELNDCGDARALEKWYHRNCFLKAERSCVQNEQSKTERLYRYMCDCEIIVFVRESLVGDKCLTLNEINESYVTSLNDKNIETMPDIHYKKRFKDLLKQNVPGIDIIEPNNKRLPHRVCLKSVVADIVERSRVATPVIANLPLITWVTKIHYYFKIRSDLTKLFIALSTTLL